MHFSPAFFDLQLRFADSIAQIYHLNFEDALLQYTNLYMQFIGRSFDPGHPLWQEYLTGLRQAPDKTMWTSSYYQRTRETQSPSSYGCFSYSYLPEEHIIRYHFVNADTSNSGPLSKERMPMRLQELTKMFAEIKKQFGDTSSVRGNSWLYNINAYRRLFPPQYTQTMQTEDDELQYMSLWGQFLRHDGRVHEERAASLLSCAQQQKSLNSLVKCFPYQVLSPQGSIASFYDFYAV
ncbi:hypothetical protein [Dictyobacter kobayashii]|uniref:Uncharacterized protein n=1 Tax=Dictyobacter kobayashii TaxID=2014872 RepID=A0A402AP56_9CHLR|nr:hypothetical protein [Dictyobacter kobayashii]GCE20896.1 hypothetical protein KDK_46960 [Dictyobacter kobayashii]